MIPWLQWQIKIRFKEHETKDEEVMNLTLEKTFYPILKQTYILYALF